MAVEPAFAADFSFFFRRLEQGEVRRQRVARSRRMVEVNRDTAEQQRLPADFGVGQSRAEFLVFGPPTLERLVEPVHAQQIPAPESLVATLDRDETVADAAHERREARCVE